MSLSFKSIVSDTKKAIFGSKEDFTQGSIGRAIFLLSVPMVLEMMMESVFAVVDIFFVSKLGADAVATVGITESLLTLVYAIAVGFSMSTIALVSRRIGEKKEKEAAKSAVQAIITGLIVSIFIAIPVIFYSSGLLKLMGASDSVINSGSTFTAILLGSNTVIMLLFINNAIFRGSGDASTAMRTLWIANIINIILDPCLIFGIGFFPELGLTGAAIATLIGRSVGVLYQFYSFFFTNGRIKLNIKIFKVDFSLIRKFISISYGGIGQYLISTSSWIALMRIMAIFGSEVLAGYTIAIRVIIFSILPSWGMSNAAATLVGQNLGANKPHRAEKSVWITAFSNAGFLCGLGIIFILNAEFIIKLFTTEELVVEIGAKCLTYISYAYVFFAFQMVISQSFNGAGDTKTPTKVNFISFWLLQIPLAYLLAITFKLNESGVFLAIVFADIFASSLSIYLFKKGTWKEKIV